MQSSLSGRGDIEKCQPEKLKILGFSGLFFEKNG